MDKKKKLLVIIAIILLILIGIAIIVLPPILQDMQLTKEEQELADLFGTYKVRADTTELPEDYIIAPVLPYVTPYAEEEFTMTPPPTAVTAPTSVPTDEVTDDATEKMGTLPEATKNLSLDSSNKSANNNGKYASAGLNMLFATATPEPTPEPTPAKEYSGANFGKYQTGTDNINPVENPDNFNTWLVEALATPSPTPVPTPTPTSTPTPTPTPVATPTPVPTPVIGKTGVDLAACHEMNKDFVAWIKIPGTNVDYPIVSTNNTSYYLDHTFDGRKSSLGTLFSLGTASWKKPSQNIIIYGHDVEGSGNKMFKALLQYKNKAFFDGHRTIYIDSMYRTGTYKVFAVFDITVGDMIPSTSNFANGKEFMTFIDTAKALSLYSADDVTINEKSTIVSLTTCDRYYKREVGRLIVMAVKVE